MVTCVVSMQIVPPVVALRFPNAALSVFAPVSALLVTVKGPAAQAVPAAAMGTPRPRIGMLAAPDAAINATAPSSPVTRNPRRLRDLAPTLTPGPPIAGVPPHTFHPRP